MIRLIIKFIVTSIVIVTISEVGKRNSVLAAIVASIPLTSLLAMVWLYLDTKDVQRVTSLSWNILIAVIPSFVFFISFPLLLKQNLNFWLSLIIAVVITSIVYYLYVMVLKYFGINLI